MALALEALSSRGPPPQPLSVKEMAYAEGTDLYLGEPADYPQDLVDALSSYFKSSLAVKKAYLAHLYAKTDEGEPPHNVVGIELLPESIKTYDEVVKEAGFVAERILDTKKDILDFIQITSESHEITEFMIDETKPFFCA